MQIFAIKSERRNRYAQQTNVNPLPLMEKPGAHI